MAVVVICPLLPSVRVFPLGSPFPEWVVGSARPVGPASCEFEAGYSWALLPVCPWVAMLLEGQGMYTGHCYSQPGVRELSFCRPTWV